MAVLPVVQNVILQTHGAGTRTQSKVFSAVTESCAASTSDSDFDPDSGSGSGSVSASASVSASVFAETGRV